MKKGLLILLGVLLVSGAVFAGRFIVQSVAPYPAGFWKVEGKSYVMDYGADGYLHPRKDLQVWRIHEGKTSNEICVILLTKDVGEIGGKK